MIKKEFFKEFSIPKNTAFIDIETSGLSPVNDDMLIISIAKFFDDNKVKIIQLISENDEKNIISEFLTNIIGIYEIYSFNGYEFEEKFIIQKLQKYNIKFDLDSIKFISYKSILKHYSDFWDISRFSRQDIEKHFKIEREKYYDMNFLIKNIKKNKLSYSNELINHNIDEIITLLELHRKIYALQFSKKSYIKDNYVYLYDFELSFEMIKLHFKSEKKYSYSQFFMQNGEKLTLYQNNIDMEIFVKTVYDENQRIVLYETEKEYIPIFIENTILYNNIYHILFEYINAVI